MNITRRFLNGLNENILTIAMGTEEHPIVYGLLDMAWVLDNILVMLHGLAHLTVQI